jgi:hypothetical protein
MAARTGLGIVLAGLALLGGCGDGSGEGSLVGGQEKLSGASSLVDLIASAPTSVPYEMTRRYEAYWGKGLQANSISYRERIYGDGGGRFAIEPVEVLEPPMATSAETVFLLVQKVRESFFFKHRDFGIRDTQLLARHWQVVDTGLTTQFLGRTCALLEVRRVKNAARVYHLTVDVANGLVLRSEEKTLAGNTVGLLEVEVLNLTPSLSGVMFHQPVTEVFELGGGGLGQERLSFIPIQPKLLPQGYHLAQSSAVLDPTTDDSWARFIYSDGVEELFFLHGGNEEEVSYGGGLGTTGGATSTGGKTKDVVKYIEMGSWTVIFGEVKGERFISMGKLPRGKLFDLVESAFF